MAISRWRSAAIVDGPIRATANDISELNEVFSTAFTDRYRRDGLSGVRVPYLNPIIWRYAIEDAADGAMLWRRSTWCTSREPKGGWARSRCDRISKVTASGRTWFRAASPGCAVARRR